MACNAVAAELCARCRVLEIDDLSWGGWKDGSAAAGFSLGIQEDPNSFGRVIDLDYNVRDALPGLPLLRTSAENGCGFCNLLREAINEGVAPHAALVSVRLSYEWSPDIYGLTTLIAHLVIEPPEAGFPMEGDQKRETRLAFGIDERPAKAWWKARVHHG
ncbi:hypothetical protein PG988_005862 [Apiospora saccharicola]